MSLTLDLPEELERRLNEAAAREGQEPGEYVRAAVEEKLGDRDWRVRMQSLLARAQAHAAAVPGTPEEIEAEIAEACEEVRAEHHARRAASKTG
jgi:metal-responsive CopG/Arc/MetJ family transcriptional regulator